MVMHGLVPYSSTAVNGSADRDRLILTAAATGSYLNYDMIYEDAAELKDTEFDVYFYANYENHVISAAAEYRALKPLYEQIADKYITGYSADENGNITVSYSGGTVVKADFSENTISYGDNTIDLDNIEKGGYFY